MKNFMFVSEDEYKLGYAHIKKLEEKNAKLRQALDEIKSLVDIQANDEGLWSLPAIGTQNIMEAMLQEALRNLHFVIESKISEIMGEK